MIKPRSRILGAVGLGVVASGVLWAFSPWFRDRLTEQDRQDLSFIRSGMDGPAWCCEEGKLVIPTPSRDSTRTRRAKLRLRALRPEISQALVANLRVRLGQVRLQAVDHLALINDSLARGALLNAVTHHWDADVRHRSLRYVLTYSDSIARESALEALHDKDDLVQRAAMAGLVRFPDPRAVTPLIEILASDRNWLGVPAGRALIAVGDTAAIGPIMSRLESVDFLSRAGMVTLLGAFRDERVTNYLIQALQERRLAGPRLEAAAALRDYDDPAVVEALAAAFDEDVFLAASDVEARATSDSGERSAILGALLTQRDPTILPVLVRIFKTTCNRRPAERDKPMCNGFYSDALEAIRSFRATDPERGVQPLAQALTEPGSGDNLRRAALNGLHNSATAAGDSIVHSVVQSTRWGVRNTAVELMARDTHRHGPAAFVALLRDSDQRVRSAATGILTRRADDQWIQEVPAGTVRYLMEEGDGVALTAMWKRVEPILIADVQSGEINRLRQAVTVFVGLGRAEQIPLLLRKIREPGSGGIATVYLNSGHDALEAAARDWAKQHGYTIFTNPGSPNVTWGSYGR